MKMFKEVRNRLSAVSESLDVDREGDIDPNFIIELQMKIDESIAMIDDFEDELSPPEGNEFDSELPTPEEELEESFEVSAVSKTAEEVLNDS